MIGSDQVAALGDETLGKPGTPDRAVDQLLQCAGQLVEFHTAVCVTGPGDEPELSHIDTTRVRFRRAHAARSGALCRAQTSHWIAPGSFKAERRGVLLLDSIDSRDPTAIQGLPLIWLGRALLSRGVPLL